MSISLHIHECIVWVARLIKTEYLIENCGVMKWKSSVENYGFLGALAFILQRIHIQSLAHSLSSKRVCVYVCACAYASQPHVISLESVLFLCFLSHTYG